MMKSNIARVVERLPLDTDNLTNTAYWVTHKLSSYTRAPAVAALYRYYRLASIKMTLQSYFPIGTASPSAAPLWVYYNMERQGYLPTAATVDYFLDNGCKPIPFAGSTNKQVTIKYKPSLLDVIAEGEGGANEIQASKPKFNEWIATHIQTAGPADALNDEIEWHGHSFYIDAFGTTPSGSTVAQYTIEAVWEFKDPYVEPTPPEGVQAMVIKKE